ncbi:DoxX family membrane protein [Domibacillus robiginosus]|uniref:DoxX family membrane protein n=1 Tax=Domibacillus robiginosus TaxID=1071054 RepID=UPI00067DB88C|nr:DoxX family membrane protein [Domibacillus robiginosus]
MKKILFFLIAFVVMMSPLFTKAHVKWFTETTPQKEAIEHILSPFFLGLSLTIAVLLGFLALLIPKTTSWPPIQRWDQRLSRLRPYSRYLLKYGTAAALLVQVMSGTLFAPEFLIEQPAVWVFVWAAILLLMIPHHLATKAGALILLGLFIYVTIHNGLFHMLDYGFYIAIIAVLLVGKTPFESKGFPFLYLGTGLSLCWVAVEKWVYPSMALDIVENHHVPTFGFDPAVFIVMAAFIEFVVGYLLVVGILNRVVAFVVTIIFISTTLLFGFTEIIGHFMIHIVLLIFIIEGVSFYNPPIKLHKTKLDQFVFVFLNFLFVLSTFLLIYYRFA